MGLEKELKAVVVIDKERCKACYLCINACPKEVIGKSRESNDASYFPAEVQNIENCVGCKRCAIVCPDTIIEIYKS